jgi:hypothetical protein
VPHSSAWAKKGMKNRERKSAITNLSAFFLITVLLV